MILFFLNDFDDFRLFMMVSMMFKGFDFAVRIVKAFDRCQRPLEARSGPLAGNVAKQEGSAG